VVLSGKLPAVQDADACDVVLVTSLRDTPHRQYLVPRDAAGLRVSPASGLDLTRRFSEVSFDRVALPASRAVHGPDGVDTLVEREVDVAAVLSSADAVGAMQRDFDLALEYAKSRVAFGRPIGSFQAIKHLLANCSLWLEMSKAAVVAAARAVGANAPEASALASVAKAYVGERAIELTQSCFQVFGGIGYTWEHDHHLVMRRLGVEAQLFGGPAWHRDRLARLGGLAGMEASTG
jgi:alkylation response protein AidB-like acyl-CoA dehydrogenase